MVSKSYWNLLLSFTIITGALPSRSFAYLEAYSGDTPDVQSSAHTDIKTLQAEEDRLKNMVARTYRSKADELNEVASTSRFRQVAQAGSNPNLLAQLTNSSQIGNNPALQKIQTFQYGLDTLKDLTNRFKKAKPEPSDDPMSNEKLVEGSIVRNGKSVKAYFFHRQMKINGTMQDVYYLSYSEDEALDANGKKIPAAQLAKIKQKRYEDLNNGLNGYVLGKDDASGQTGWIRVGKHTADSMVSPEGEFKGYLEGEFKPGPGTHYEMDFGYDLQNQPKSISEYHVALKDGKEELVGVRRTWEITGDGKTKLAAIQENGTAFVQVSDKDIKDLSKQFNLSEDTLKKMQADAAAKGENLMMRYDVKDGGFSSLASLHTATVGGAITDLGAPSAAPIFYPNNAGQLQRNAYVFKDEKGNLYTVGGKDGNTRYALTETTNGASGDKFYTMDLKEGDRLPYADPHFDLVVGNNGTMRLAKTNQPVTESDPYVEKGQLIPSTIKHDKESLSLDPTSLANGVPLYKDGKGNAYGSNGSIAEGSVERVLANGWKQTEYYKNGQVVTMTLSKPNGNLALKTDYSPDPADPTKPPVPLVKTINMVSDNGLVASGEPSAGNKNLKEGHTTLIVAGKSQNFPHTFTLDADLHMTPVNGVFQDTRTGGGVEYKNGVVVAFYTNGQRVARQDLAKPTTKGQKPVYPNMNLPYPETSNGVSVTRNFNASTGMPLEDAAGNPIDPAVSKKDQELILTDGTKLKATGKPNEYQGSNGKIYIKHGNSFAEKSDGSISLQNGVVLKPTKNPNIYTGSDGKKYRKQGNKFSVIS